MIDIDFINDNSQKVRLEADLKELHITMNNKATKSSLVLIGGLIESFIYYFVKNHKVLANKIPNFEKRNLGLNDLLQFARKNGLISEELFRISEPIRDFRNTIHPKVQERIQIELNQSMVEIGYNVLLEIIRHLRDKYAEVNLTEHKRIIREIIHKEFEEEPDDSDYAVYLPILEKYNLVLGALIIERSIRYGNQ